MLNLNGLLEAQREPWQEETDAEEELHEIARCHALTAAREGYARSGRGAVIVPWPPEETLSVSFFARPACVPLGDEVLRRVAAYDPQEEFVMVYLFQDGGIDAYTYRIPESRPLRGTYTLH